MREITYPHVKESIFYERMPNGLDVYILAKPGFRKTYATFATKYGSIDNHFQVSSKSAVQVPDGIAHFLEHKMFEEPEGDIFAQFASLGASANAYTSFDRTVYLFSATDHIAENLETLINFVQNPYFTEENVEKEKGIIGQEIKMYRDNPDWRSYYGLIEALYHVHPIHIDIAGTVESIAQISKDTLYTCYHTFYHPANMNLFVVGGVDPEQTMKLVRDNQARKSFPPQGEIQRIFENEPASIRSKVKTIKLPVSLPKCLFGLKEDPAGRSGNESMKRELVMKLVLDVLFSQSSDMYQSLYDAGLITDNFGHEYNNGTNYAFTVIGGDTPDPDRMLEQIRSRMTAILEQGLDPISFERSRKKKMGAYLRMLNSPEAIAGEYTKCRFQDMDFFDILPMYESLSLDDANEAMRSHFDWNQMAVSVVRSDAG